jgi:[glutamine synthetase] adenylyltransferase / [glutamine synthetase]-adenylyl-L-tyrosine phosphorylase
MIPDTKIPKVLFDVAEEKWDALIRTCQGVKLDAPTDPDMTRAIKRVFGLSDFVAKRCVHHPDMLIDLITSQDLKRSYPHGEYTDKIHRQCAHAEDMSQLCLLLRQLRTREMCRIAFRDLAGWSDLSETMKDLSDLADASLHFTQSILYQWLVAEYGTPREDNGEPQRLVILGLGKLGGGELNFSSDIDLMFAFPQAGQTDHPVNPISNEQFFARLCQRIMEVIGKNLTEGFVFRVDARLRPFGESGPIAMSFDAMESYYQQMGREWERYALIKARVVAGDEFAGGELLERLKPFVYRRYLDFGTFESLREMKARITREITRKGMAGNIKLGSGGIREIEFFGQVFQLIRGGVNPDYQERRILNILQVLARDNCVPDTVSRELADAYVFLRNTENRLQMINDLQTHTLPENPMDQRRLAFSMGFDDWPDFVKTLDIHMGNVHRHFEALLGAEEIDSTGDGEVRMISEVWDNLQDKERSLEILKNLGMDQVDDVYAVLGLFRELSEAEDVSSQGKRRLSLLAPQILHKAMKSKDPVKILKRIYTLVNSFRRRSCYAALLLEKPDALTHLVNLAEASPLVISFLSQHPLLLDELIDIRALYAPLSKTALQEELRERLARIDGNDLELEMDGLRIFKQVNTFRVAAADVAGLLPLMKVSDRLTYLAETVVDQALEMSWDHLVDRYGIPSGIQKDQKGFAIIAYGKLGGFELGYGSDLDLVFLHAGSKGNTQGGRMGILDNTQFYSRLGQRIIHFLSTMTRTGKLYDIDMRLRPSGSSGILVSQMDAFEDYLIKQAWTWEHQALIKARPVSGDADVGKDFLSIRKKILCIHREKVYLREEVVGMREKMRKEHASRSPGFFDLKQDPGGVIDIEFIVQFLILLEAGHHPELTQWTDVVRQLNTMALTGIIDDRTAHILKQAYLVFRYCIHRLALEEKPALLGGDRFRDLRGEVCQIWGMHMA